MRRLPAGFPTETYQLRGAKNPIEVVSGQISVKYRKGVAEADAAASRQALHAEKLGELPRLGWTFLRLPPGMSVQSALISLSADPTVELAEPSRVYRPQRVPSDPLFPQQYGLSIIDAAAAWEFDVGASTTVTIAVIDAGIDSTHPDLAAKVLPTMNAAFDENTGASSSENPPTTACGHGTNVAGVAAAATDNSLDVAGVSWGAKLLSLRVFSAADQCAGTSDQAIAAAIDYAVGLAISSEPAVGRMVINMSLGEPANGPCSTILTNAVTLAETNGVSVVAAAGNDPTSGVMCPGAIPKVIAVSATDSKDNIASFSSTGPQLWVAAPGVGILTTQRTQDGGGTETVDGTSFASPHVAGLVALLFSANPLLTPDQIRLNLQQTSDNLGAQSTFGYGRINAFKALRLVEKGTLSGFEGQQKVIAFPNPAQFSRGSVTFVLPPGLQGSNLSIKIYTIAGEPVRNLSGATWDGRNDSGAEVAAGTYIYLVKTNNGKALGRIAVVH